MLYLACVYIEWGMLLTFKLCVYICSLPASLLFLTFLTCKDLFVSVSHVIADGNRHFLCFSNTLQPFPIISFIN